MMVGRFAGSYLMRRFPATRVLACFALFATVVMIGAATLHGPVAMWCLILVGLGHSIMFPAIFAMGIKGLGPLTEEASGLLIMAIAGGALVVVQGWLADLYGLQNSFWLTVACELYVLWYALWGSKPTAVAQVGEAQSLEAWAPFSRMNARGLIDETDVHRRRCHAALRHFAPGACAGRDRDDRGRQARRDDRP
jgi:MFS family permease